MIFKEGTYKHQNGLEIYVDATGTAYIKGNNIPLTVRTSEIFDNTNGR